MENENAGSEPAVVTPTPDAGQGAGGAPGNPGEQRAETPAEWYAGLPETLRDDPSIAKYHSGGLEALAQGHVNLAKMVGVPADKVRKIPDAQDADALREYLAPLGLPDTADDFKLSPTANSEGQPLPEGFGPDGDLAKVFAAACHAANVPPSLAQPVFDQCNKFLFEATQAQAREKEARQAKNVQTLRETLGPGFDETVAAADYVAHELDLFDVLDGAGIGHEPRVIHALAKLAPLYSEASGLGNLPTRMGGTQTVAELNARADELQAQALQLRQGDPRKKQLTEQALALREQAYK
jgi:hypothetical protein